MPKTGVANLPLHGGAAPRWLFKRMVALSKGIITVISEEYRQDEIIQRFSDPFWFQSLACVLGFDWHSSGCTTVTCGALKEAIQPEEHGIAIGGGKGKASQKTLAEINQYSHVFNLPTFQTDDLTYASRMTAKIDNAAVQDGHVLYHHCILFSEHGAWTVVQQGMNADTCYARRYHWNSLDLSSFTVDPHNAILGDHSHLPVLDMTAHNSQDAQQISIDLVKDNPRHLQRDWASLTKPSSQQTLDSWMSTPNTVKPSVEQLDMPRMINWQKMKALYDFQPHNYEELLTVPGVGPRTVRALALISDLIYGEKPSWKDPVKYSFTVGGKDGVPYPVDRRVMDEATDILQQGIQQAQLGKKDKLRAIQRLRTIIPAYSV